MTATNEHVGPFADYRVRATKNAQNENIQHVRLDVGNGVAESLVTTANPLPVMGDVTVSSAALPTGGATEEGQTALLDQLKNGDCTIYGDAGPLQQHEKEQPDYPARELLTYDTNMHTVLGSQPLLSDDRKKIKVESSQPSDLRVEGMLATRNLDEIMINLNGHASVAFQIGGTWTGTISFFGTIDYQTWYAWSCQVNAAILSTAAITTTASGIWQAKVVGLKAFKVQFTTATTGTPRVVLQASYAPISYQTQVTATIVGSQVAAVSQRPATLELSTADTAVREALYVAEPYVSNIVYSLGDVVFFNGRNYRCIAQTPLTVGNFSPTNATYWALDIRPARSLVSNSYVSAPDAPRLRIEHDLDLYQYQIQEQVLLTEQMQMMNYMINSDYSLSVRQGQGGQYGKN